MVLLAPLLLAFLPPQPADDPPVPNTELFARDNLVAWCIVPFDAQKRGPRERAEMLARLGFKHFAYDYRAEHVPTFEAEIAALKQHGVSLDAWWFPADLNDEARLILGLLERHGLKTQLWVTGGGEPVKTEAEQQARVRAEADRIRPIVEAAGRIGCTVGLYNHGGWFGEPENQLAVIAHLKLDNVGLVYNLHHGHDHLDRFPALLEKMLPHLIALNLNGMVKEGDKSGRKILPLGQGSLDLDLLRTIRDSGYRGPIGILGHTQDDAEDRLRDNLDGLDWLLPQLDGKAPDERPVPRTPVPPPPPGEVSSGQPVPYRPELAEALVAEARALGDYRRGAVLFRSNRFACISCHKVAGEGGLSGPDLTRVAACLTPQQIAEALLWPKLLVKPEFSALAVVTKDGLLHQGYKRSETEAQLVLSDCATGLPVAINKDDVDERREIGSIMPEGLVSAMTPAERRDVVRLLLELGAKDARPSQELMASDHRPAAFEYDRAPLDRAAFPGWQSPVNRERLYDFYQKQAEFFRTQSPVPLLLGEFPGLDGGALGHWGNQNEQSWADDRWNRTDLGNLLCGVFHAPGMTVPKGVALRLGDDGQLSTCFDPQSLTYPAAWTGGFVRFSSVRHGFLDGLIMDGVAATPPDPHPPAKEFTYRGFYRHGKRVIFSYRLGGEEMLDAPWVEEGRLVRTVAPAHRHPLAPLTKGGPALWPTILETKGTLGATSPYAVDTIELPFDNPGDSPLFVGGHDFTPDGTAYVCTMQGDVWRVDGLDERLERVRWKRFASGLHQPQGLLVSQGSVLVLGRDQITRLHDLNEDAEADFYECVTNAYFTSPAGHDFVCGLEQDNQGAFYTASGNQGLIRLSPDGKTVEVLATGFRNPDGLGLYPDGAVTVPCSEGEWTPASMLCLVRPQAAVQAGVPPPHFGYGGPKEGRPPELPLVYLPRGLDNSSGGQTMIQSRRWGPLDGLAVHFSYGAGSHFLLLRDEVDGQPQGAVVPLPGEFRSGAHRGRFNPADGQLYVSGMAGWGTYTPDDGSFQRVRYTGAPVQLPVAFRARRNGVLVTFSSPVDREVAEAPASHFIQAWNYRYSSAYGSPEFSPRHPGTPGHDPLAVTSAHLLDDGRTLFLEIPDLQPVNQLHLHLRTGGGPPHDLFATVHRLGAPFEDFPGYRPLEKVIAAHPILADLSIAAATVPNPFKKRLPGSREIEIRAGQNLSFLQRTLRVEAGEPIKLVFVNPDVVPHNWVLVRTGRLEAVGSLANLLIADPDAAGRHYVPESDYVLCYTDVVPPQGRFTVYFTAPAEKGRYPYLCTFPGHWMVMNGLLEVE
jgi:putative heme-binding domain-containing protein